MTLGNYVKNLGLIMFPKLNLYPFEIGKCFQSLNKIFPLGPRKYKKKEILTGSLHPLNVWLAAWYNIKLLEVVTTNKTKTKKRRKRKSDFDSFPEKRVTTEVSRINYLRSLNLKWCARWTMPSFITKTNIFLFVIS